MAGIYSVNFQALQHIGTAFCCCFVINKGIENGLIDVFKQISAEKVTLTCQNTDGSFRMSGFREDSRFNSIFRKIIIVLDKVRRESFPGSKSGEYLNQFLQLSQI